MRAFIALDFKDEDKQYFKNLFSQFSHLKSLRWVAKEHIHLTLRFFPDINGTQLVQIIGILQMLSNKYSFIDYSLSENIGFFPNKNKPRVMFLNVKRGKREIITLYNDLMNLLDRYKLYNYDKKPFYPHITIARIKYKEDLSNLQKVKIRYKGRIFNLTFYKSILTPSGPIYQVIKSFKLKESLK